MSDQPKQPAGAAFQPDRSSQMEQAMASPLPMARRDLQISPQLYLGKTVYVVKDPVSLTYFRLKPAEHYVLKNLDGQVSANDMARRVTRHFPDQPAEPEDVMGFIKMLQGSGLLLGRGETHAGWIRNIRDTRRRKTMRAKTMNFLFIKIPVMDPDEMLDAIYSYTRFFMNRTTMWLAAIFMTLAFGAVLFNIDRVSNLEFPVLGWTNLLLLTGTFFVVKVIHEFGHGLAAKHRALEVHEIGVMLMVFFPIFYVDVSDAWMVRRRRDRMWITAGGVYIEMLFAAFAAVVFLTTDPGLVNQIAFNTMLAASITTILFNANPLLRYDGYYFLMDYLQIPNLRAKASKYTGYLAKRYLLGMRGEMPPEEASTHPFFMPFYSVAAGFYRWFIVIGIVALVWHILDPYGLELIGALMGTVAIITMLLLPLFKMLKWVWSQQKARPARQVAISFLGLLALFGIAAAILAIPTEQTVEQPVVVLAADRQPVYCPVPGRIEAVHRLPGERVAKGDPLITLRDDKLHEELERLDVRYRLARLELETRRADGRIEEVSLLTIRLQHLREQIAHFQAKIDQLVVRAPIDGRLEPERRFQALIGSVLEPGEHLATIIGDDVRQVVMIIPETDASLIDNNDPVRVRLWGSAGLERTGVVQRLSSKQLTQLPHEALSSRFGGEVDTVATSQYNSAPSAASVTATIAMDPGQPPLPLDGSTGRAKVVVGDKVTIAAQQWRALQQMFSPDWRLMWIK